MKRSHPYSGAPAPYRPADDMTYGKKKKRPGAGTVIGICAAAFVAISALVLIVIFVSNTSVQTAQRATAAEPESTTLFTLDDTLITDKNGLRYYSDKKYTSVCGVDVSTFQKDIDWDAVAAAGVKFAILRVGYRGYQTGTLGEDAYFKTNIEGAKKAGIDVGVYFFSQALNADEAREEADYTAGLLSGYKLEYPVVFDHEDIEGDARTDNMTNADRTAAAGAFCAEIESKGYTAMIYGSTSYLTDRIDRSALSAYEFWAADYTDTPALPFTFRMWQYTKTGTVDGIDGSVDINIWLKEK